MTYGNKHTIMYPRLVPKAHEIKFQFVRKEDVCIK